MKELNFPSDIKTNQEYPSKIRFRIFDGADLADDQAKFKIILPVPIALNNGYSVQFDDMEVGLIQRAFQSTAVDIAVNAAKNPGQSLATSTVDAALDGTSNVLKAGAAAALGDSTLGLGQFLRGPFGYNVNKAGTLAVNKPSNRNFSFRFEFVPNDEKEAEEIERIIEAFKLSMHPVTESSDSGAIGGAAGFFYFNPSKFKIDFLFEDKDEVNKNIFSTWFCFLTGMEVNYHNSGAPSYTTGGYQSNKAITLSFTEISPLNRGNIKKFEGHTDIADVLPINRSITDAIRTGSSNVISQVQGVDFTDLPRGSGDES